MTYRKERTRCEGCGRAFVDKRYKLLMQHEKSRATFSNCGWQAYFCSDCAEAITRKLDNELDRLHGWKPERGSE